MNRLSFLLCLLVLVVAVGCGRNAKKDSGSRKETITDKGSDSMVLLAQKWSEKFREKNPNIDIQVVGGGTGTGISALINGTTDICNASRPFKDEERQQVKQKFGSDVVEIPVALDGLSVYVNTASPVDSLTIEQVRGFFSGKVTNWKEVGGPDAKVILYSRENNSGTYDFFKEHVLNKGDFATVTQYLPGTAAVVNSVSKDVNGIGYGGAAYGKGIKELKIIGDKGVAVAPTEDNVRSGAYPLSRKLFFYLRISPTGATKQYIDWVLSPEGQAAAKEAGYFPL